MAISNKERYRLLCEQQNIPLFMQAWWMDAVCNNEAWDVLIAEENGKILGTLVFHLKKKWGLTMIIKPLFTQYGGVWLNYPDHEESYKKYAFDEKVMNMLIEQLGRLKIHYYEQSFHHSILNWQPFYWNGFKQTTRYTYVIDNITDGNEIFRHFHYFKQRHINKAAKNYSVDYNLDLTTFYNFHKYTHQAKGEALDYNKETLISLHKAITERNQGTILAIKDGDNILSAMFLVWDKNTGYYLLSAIDPATKSSGASMLMVWEAIKFLADGRALSFDFEGSMIKGVAKANQEFGGIQKPYHTVTKSYSKTASLLIAFKKQIHK